MTQTKFTENLTVVVFFLYHAEQEDPNMMFGSHTVTEAFDAMARNMLLDPDKLRKCCSETNLCNA